MATPKKMAEAFNTIYSAVVCGIAFTDELKRLGDDPWLKRVLVVPAWQQTTILFKAEAVEKEFLRIREALDVFRAVIKPTEPQEFRQYVD